MIVFIHGWHVFTINPLAHYIHDKLWDALAYPFPKFNGIDRQFIQHLQGMWLPIQAGIKEIWKWAPAINNNPVLDQAAHLASCSLVLLWIYICIISVLNGTMCVISLHSSEFVHRTPEVFLDLFVYLIHHRFRWMFVLIRHKRYQRWKSPKKRIDAVDLGL